MIIFFWFILFLIVFIIIFYGLLKDLNTLILKKYLIYFCELSLKEVYESGEETYKLKISEISQYQKVDILFECLILTAIVSHQLKLSRKIS
jgi:hypothetical protein